MRRFLLVFATMLAALAALWGVRPYLSGVSLDWSVELEYRYRNPLPGEINPAHFALGGAGHLALLDEQGVRLVEPSGNVSTLRNRTTSGVVRVSPDGRVVQAHTTPALEVVTLNGPGSLRLPRTRHSECDAGPCPYHVTATRTARWVEDFAGERGLVVYSLDGKVIARPPVCACERGHGDCCPTHYFVYDDGVLTQRISGRIADDTVDLVWLNHVGEVTASRHETGRVASVSPDGVALLRARDAGTETYRLAGPEEGQALPWPLHQLRVETFALSNRYVYVGTSETIENGPPLAWVQGKEVQVLTLHRMSYDGKVVQSVELPARGSMSPRRTRLVVHGDETFYLARTVANGKLLVRFSRFDWPPD